MYGGAAAVAALAGGGFAAWQRGVFQQPLAMSAPDSQAVAEAFWKLSFDSPSGVPFAMTSFKGKPLLVNFWATWCPPCVEELPLLDYFFQENKSKNWQVLGLAVGALVGLLEGKNVGLLLGGSDGGSTPTSKHMYLLNFLTSRVPKPVIGSQPTAALNPCTQQAGVDVQLFFPNVMSLVYSAGLL